MQSTDPMGIAMGPDGSMYFADSEIGRIWQVTYKGDKKKFLDPISVLKWKTKLASNIRNPDIIITDDLDRNIEMRPQSVKNIYHILWALSSKKNGMGALQKIPAMLASDWVSKSKLINKNKDIFQNGRKDVWRWIRMEWKWMDDLRNGGEWNTGSDRHLSLLQLEYQKLH